MVAFQWSKPHIKIIKLWVLLSDKLMRGTMCRQWAGGLGVVFVDIELWDGNSLLWENCKDLTVLEYYVGLGVTIPKQPSVSDK